MEETMRNASFIFHTHQSLEKGNDKLDQIIVAFRPELGHAGALAFEKELRSYLKDKKSIALAIQEGYLCNLLIS